MADIGMVGPQQSEAGRDVGGRAEAEHSGVEAQRKEQHRPAERRKPYTTTPRQLPSKHGNSRVTAPRPPLCYCRCTTYLRKFSTPVILYQAREGVSARENLRQVFRRCLFAALSFRLGRNGGHRSIEESEIRNLRWIPEGFGVISGRAFLHRDRAQTQT